MSLEIGRLDHAGLGLVPLGRGAFHHPGGNAHLALSPRVVMQCLVRPAFHDRIPPARAIPIDEDDPAPHTPIINLRLCMAPGEIRPKTFLQLVR